MPSNLQALVAQVNSKIQAQQAEQAAQEAQQATAFANANSQARSQTSNQPQPANLLSLAPFASSTTAPATAQNSATSATRLPPQARAGTSSLLQQQARAQQQARTQMRQAILHDLRHDLRQRLGSHLQEGGVFTSPPQDHAQTLMDQTLHSLFSAESLDFDQGGNLARVQVGYAPSELEQRTSTLPALNPPAGSPESGDFSQGASRPAAKATVAAPKATKDASLEADTSQVRTIADIAAQVTLRPQEQATNAALALARQQLINQFNAQQRQDFYNAKMPVTGTEQPLTSTVRVNRQALANQTQNFSTGQNSAGNASGYASVQASSAPLSPSAVSTQVLPAATTQVGATGTNTTATNPVGALAALPVSMSRLDLVDAAASLLTPGGQINLDALQNLLQTQTQRTVEALQHQEAQPLSKRQQTKLKAQQKKLAHQARLAAAKQNPIQTHSQTQTINKTTKAKVNKPQQVIRTIQSRTTVSYLDEYGQLVSKVQDKTTSEVIETSKGKNWETKSTKTIHTQETRGTGVGFAQVVQGMAEQAAVSMHQQVLNLQQQVQASSAGSLSGNQQTNSLGTNLTPQLLPAAPILGKESEATSSWPSQPLLGLPSSQPPDQLAANQEPTQGATPSLPVALNAPSTVSENLLPSRRLTTSDDGYSDVEYLQAAYPSKQGQYQESLRAALLRQEQEDQALELALRPKESLSQHPAVVKATELLNDARKQQQLLAASWQALPGTGDAETGATTGSDAVLEPQTTAAQSCSQSHKSE